MTDRMVSKHQDTYTDLPPSERDGQRCW